MEAMQDSMIPFGDQVTDMDSDIILLPMDGATDHLIITLITGIVPGIWAGDTEALELDILLSILTAEGTINHTTIITGISLIVQAGEAQATLKDTVGATMTPGVLQGYKATRTAEMYALLEAPQMTGRIKPALQG